MACQYGPSTGYFAMPAGYQDTIQMHSSKEFELLMKKERQSEIGEQLSRRDAEEYGDDILDYMFEQEVKCLPCVESIDIQTEIQWYMRPYLLDFLIEAHAAFGLLPETLFLAVNLLDRYCSKRVVYRKHYQLVGCTALLIAAKYGECSKKVPHVKELASMCCQLYDEDMFIQMERHVMVTLDWYVGSPTVDGFLQAALDECMQDAEVEHMALYLAEIALFHRDFVSKRPSDMARSSLALARIILNRDQPLECQWAACYDSDILVELSQHLHRPSQVLIQKYRSSNMSRVSDTLNGFLERHAAIARYNAQTAAPLTPPAELPSPSSHRVPYCTHALSTPQKSQFPNNMPHGCLTPPITPDIEVFEGYNGNKRCPETPTPNSHLVPEYVQYQSSYYAHGVL